MRGWCACVITGPSLDAFILQESIFFSLDPLHLGSRELEPDLDVSVVHHPARGQVPEVDEGIDADEIGGLLFTYRATRIAEARGAKPRLRANLPFHCRIGEHGLGAGHVDLFP